jgi:hypothetical protein
MDQCLSRNPYVCDGLVAGVWVAKAAFGSWWFGEIFRSVAKIPRSI